MLYDTIDGSYLQRGTPSNMGEWQTDVGQADLGVEEKSGRLMWGHSTGS